MMTEYHIILEEVLTPDTSKKYLDELRKRGWIHANTPCRKKKDDTYYLSVVCTAELLGKIVGYLLENVGWVIVEQMPEKTRVKDMPTVEYQQVIPF